MDDIANLTPKSLQAITWQDLLSRAQVGGFFYLPTWLIISLSFDIQHIYPQFFWINTLLFIFLALARFLFIQYAQRLEYDHTTRPRRLLIGFVLLSALHWGVTTAILLWTSPHNTALHQLLFSVMAALAAGGAITYSLFNYIGLLYPLFIVTIPFATQLCKQSNSIIFYLFVSVVFFILTYYLTRSTHSHYIKTYQHYKLLSLYANTMERLSKLDFLTKLNNRYQFLIELEMVWQHSIKQQTPLSLMSIDIDNLNKLNHDYGHYCGDQCLSTLADIIRAQFSAPNILARYGSEELMIAMPDTALPAAEAAAQKLLETIRKNNITCNDHNMSFTCSIGIVSTTATKFSSPEAFIHNADKLLLEAKANGRDCYAAKAVTT